MVTLKPDKGKKNGSCNITSCQKSNSAIYYNHVMNAYYCPDCAAAINASCKQSKMDPICILEEQNECGS